MKRIKKVLALVTTLAMLLTMVAATGLTAFAADPTGSITITGAQTDPEAATTTYEAYRIFDMTTTGATDTSGNYTAVAYTINSAWADFFADGAPGAAYLVDTDSSGNLNQITVDGAKKYINITDSNVADFAKAAFAFAQKANIAPTTYKDVAKGTTEVKFEGLALGYYMVYPKGASVQLNNYTSIVSITNTAPNGKIAQKAKYPELKKKADDISVEVGQKVTYTLTSNVPDTTGYNTKYEMTFSDKTTAGLTFDGKGTIVVKIGTQTLTAGTDYTVTDPTDDADFTVTIDMLTGNAPNRTAKYTYNDPITVTYTATVNEKAVTKIDENHATLTYNNDPKDDDSKGTTPPVEVPTYSSKLIINKIDANNKTIPLSGAKFVLRVKTPGSVTGDSHETDLVAGSYYFYDTTAKDVKWIVVDSNKQKPADLAQNTDITIVTTDAQGKANFDGLEDGIYELIEVEAPEGYNLLTAPVEVTIDGSDATEVDLSPLTVTQPVENNSGTQLPGTGGIGTTIFYILGSLLVVGCGIVLVSRKRMQNNK